MTLRHVVLTGSGLAVLGLGIYLFLEVRAVPATADVAKRPATARSGDVRRTEPAEHTSGTKPETRREARKPTPVRDATAGAGGTSPPEVPTESPEGRRVDLGKEATMAEANKAYDRSDFDEAQVIAEKVLKDDPNNVRMLRIMVSASCIQGDSVIAQKYYLSLPAPDREQMRTRCERYGISFNEQ